MGLLKFGVVHCCDTHPHYSVTAGVLNRWHKGPRDIVDEKGKLSGVKYMGYMYPDREHLPDEEIDGFPVKKLYGRGWDRIGYSDLIRRDGMIINLTPYDDDHVVQSHEMTWGVAGVNACSRHVCLEGGRTLANESGLFDFDVIFTDAQFTSLIGWTKQFLKDQPQAKIAGHNQFTDLKTCPNFLIPNFMLMYEIPEDRIYLIV